jgi:beta-glucosidase
MSNVFPDDFLWGTATASYQIEGAAQLDGRGVSIWDTFSKTPGKVVGSDNGDVACDHYHRYPEDIEIMRDLGVKAYRLSIAWPRLFPNGDGVREERGFNFYNNLIDSLIEAGIEPMVTLYHWDLPQQLEDEGGWANRATAEAFADYALACAEEFGDRVSNWITLNEPWCVAWLGYSIGVHAPGKKDHALAIAASHHTALAHSLATRAIKSIRPAAQVGLTVNMTNHNLENPENSELVTLNALLDSNINRWWIEAMLYGKYPANILEYYGQALTDVLLPGDQELLKSKPDYLGINYYSDSFLRNPRPEDLVDNGPGIFPFPQKGDNSPPAHLAGSLTAMGWVVTPEGLGNLVARVHRDYPEIPYLMITENGSSYEDVVESDGNINDVERTSYLVRHLQSLQKAIAAGVPVKGYFAWSLLDNFEWAEGYAKRFGLVRVDYQTLVRTPKLSAKKYKQIVATNSPD